MMRSLTSFFSFFVFASLVAWATPMPSAGAREMKPVTGHHWSTATEQEKKAFLYGMGTMIQLEHEVAKQQGISENRASLVPTFVRGLEGTNLVGVMQVIDAYYARNPTQLDRPVVDVIWRDIVLPGAQQAQAEQER